MNLELISHSMQISKPIADELIRRTWIRWDTIGQDPDSADIYETQEFLDGLAGKLKSRKSQNYTIAELDWILHELENELKSNPIESLVLGMKNAMAIILGLIGDYGIYQDGELLLQSTRAHCMDKRIEWSTKAGNVDLEVLPITYVKYDTYIRKHRSLEEEE